MCRIFAYTGNLADPDFRTAVTAFAKLAQDGNVPLGIRPGHLDGWGLHATVADQDVYMRSVHPATPDDLLRTLAPVMTQVGTVIVHLRKATIGVNDVTNTHPFVRAGVSFCHNGSIRSFPNPEPPRHHEGDTDSEKYFLRIIDRVLLNAQQSLQALGASLESVIADIQAGGDWTSLTCLMKTQEGLLIKYLWNESHPMTEAGKLNDYYTFYKGTKGGATILCSEQLPVDGVVWESLANGTLMTVPSAQAHI